MRDNTVCAVVVTYNRKNLLLECLEAIRRQTRPVDAIYIIDNASTDGTPEVLKENGYIPELPPFNLSEPYEIEHKISNLVDGNPINVFYVRMYENTGSAGGFYEGVKRGYERGYDWLWLMDDDGLPEKDCLMNLYKCTNDLNIVGSLVVASDNSSELTWKLRVVDSLGNFIPRTYFSNVEEVKRHAKNGIYYGIPNFFNSIIIKKDVISIVGFPNKDLFIWGVEAGLRSFDRTMPEEINRILTDAISDYLFVSEESGVKNLKREGIPDEKIFFVGNVMIDSLISYLPKVERSEILGFFSLKPSQYGVVTLHRPSNVDSKERLKQIIDLLVDISEYKRIVFPIHPRTAQNLEKYDLLKFLNHNIIATKPLGYIDFIALIKNSAFVLTDSGGYSRGNDILRDSVYYFKKFNRKTSYR